MVDQSPLHRNWRSEESKSDNSYIKEAAKDIEFIANHLKKQEVYEKVHYTRRSLPFI